MAINRERKQIPENPEQKKKKGFLKSKTLSIINVVLTILSHVSIALIVYFSYQYYNLSRTTFICALGAIACLLIITDIILIVGNSYNDKVIKLVNFILALAICAVGVFGDITMFKLTSSVNKVIENSGSEQYEKISVSFVSYKKEYKDIKEIDGKKVGVLYETSVGTNSLGQEKIEKAGINCTIIECVSTNDLFFGLIEGTIDVAIMPGSYRQLYENSDDTDYSEYLEQMYDFYSFEEHVLVAENENANKNLTDEPFNILLIGFAQNDASSSYGLADTIILATVNPQTMTVSLTSIARDSYVPISCYGGTSDKINAARGTSRACLMETVSNLLDVDIDFYAEVNFQGIVNIVDALGGIIINSPVEFIGQTSSVERGHMNVKVFAGEHNALGEEVLAFCRERHAMPNGDFDRQKHQKEVISAIAKKIINTRDINTLLNVLEACGDNISTNLSITQLTNIFNYIISVPNYLDVTQFDMIDIQSLRITGYSSWHYSDQLQLPLWIYKLYNGSVDETKAHINELLGEYGTIDQSDHQYFFETYPYYRESFYSTSFDEAEVHEKLPLYCPYLTNMTYTEAVAWANANGIILEVTNVTTGYDESLSGMVVSQGMKYGKRLSSGDKIAITVFGVDPSLQVPDFTDMQYTEVVKWAKEYNYAVTYQEITSDIKGLGGTVIEQTPAAGSLREDYNSITIKYYSYASVDASALKGKTKQDAVAWTKENLYYPDTVIFKNLATTDSSKYNTVASASFGGGTVSKTNDKTLVITIYVEAQNFNITVVSEDNSKGTVSGGGLCSNANTHVISAIAAEGYKFVGWYIGSDLASTEANYTISVSKDETYTAKFEARSTFTVDASSADTSMGTVTVSPGSTAYEGETITVTAAPISADYVFVGWNDGSDQATRTFTSNATVVADFAAAPAE